MFFLLWLLQAASDITGDVAQPVLVTPETWGVVAGVIIPYVVALIKTPITDARISTLLTLVFSLVGGIGGAWVGGEISFTGSWDVARILSTATLAFTSATAYYNLRLRDQSEIVRRLEVLGFTNPAPPETRLQGPQPPTNV